MRTTVTIDDDIVEKLNHIKHKSHESFTRVMNDTLRRGLSTQDPPATKGVPFRVDTFSSPFRAGVDPMRLHQLLDDLEIQAKAGGVPR